ncbi:MAG: DUF4124 domain-containing protein [Burkholderiales bacterium]
MNRHRSRRLGAGIALLVAATVAAGQGSVVKCVDADGNVTYQDAPCTRGQAGRSVELPKAETREDTGAWEAAARDAQVVRGMPKRWVLRSRGTPAEIRPATAREEATEVWRYQAKDGALLVGFAGSNVAWVRDEAAPRTPVAAKSAGTAAGAPTRGAQNRRFVIAGRYCEHVFAEIGAADREEPLATPGAAAGTRYVYEPQEGDPQIRTVFSCVDGKVADVERTVVR